MILTYINLYLLMISPSYVAPCSVVTKQIILITKIRFSNYYINKVNAKDKKNPKFYSIGFINNLWFLLIRNK
jgi:hypothetical protein